MSRLKAVISGDVTLLVTAWESFYGDQSVTVTGAVLRFSDLALNKGQCTLVDRDHKNVIIKRTDRDIVVIIGPDRTRTVALADVVFNKINDIR